MRGDRAAEQRREVALVGEDRLPAEYPQVPELLAVRPRDAALLAFERLGDRVAQVVQAQVALLGPLAVDVLLGLPGECRVDDVAQQHPGRGRLFLGEDVAAAELLGARAERLEA